MKILLKFNIKKMLLEDDVSLNHSFTNTVGPLFLEKVLRNFENAGEWCDIKHSNKIETCAEKANWMRMLLELHLHGLPQLPV